MEDVYKFYNKRVCPAKVAGHFIRDEYHFYFKSTKSNLKYCVEAVNHSENFFAIKFYCTAHKLSKNKYSLHTNTFEAYKVINSCVQVIPELLKIYPKSSFVAVGSRSIIDDSIEPTSNNRRYKIYCKKLLTAFENRDDYLLIMLPEISGMALVYVGDLLGETIRNKKAKIRYRINKIKDVVLSCYEDIQIVEL